MEDEAGQEISAGRRHIIERPRLTKLLDETSARVIMLIAPAGYGKTTLARQWLAERSHAWYQGGASSGDVAALALGVAAAVEPLAPQAGRRLREWLPTSREPEQELEVIEQFLAEDLMDWPNDAWFVIDDYQLLSSEPAEELTRRLFVTTGRRLLLTSRQRPTWSSARQLLYGNFFELGQSSLAMDTEEANAVIASGDRGAASGLVALAGGWPAVIALAALAPSAIRLEDGFPEQLHDYFAEELLASLPTDTQEGLSLLALLPVVTLDAAETLLGNGAEPAIESGKKAGMFTTDRGQVFTFHPLLRTFLMQKLHRSRPEVAAAVNRAARYLIENEAWDEAFALIAEFEPRPELLNELFARATVPLTRLGRLATLREWLDHARQTGVLSPYLDLAEAELAFRRGRQERGGALARAAAASLDADDPLLSVAHYRAGQSRHLVDDSSGALQHFEAAQSSARTASDRQNAVWGRFIVAFELERHETSELLGELEALAGQDRNALVRAECGRLMLALCDGGSIPPGQELSPLIERAAEATDPLVRSALFRALAAVLVLAADYRRALKAVDQALAEAERFHLEFVRPHSLLGQAAAHIGQRRFSEAAAAIGEIEIASQHMDDAYLAANADILRCRLLLSEGSAQAALESVSGGWSRGPTPARKMEFDVTRAAALACSGEPKVALEVLDQVEGTSRGLEPQLLLQWIRSVCHLLIQPEQAKEEVVAAYAATSSSGAYDALVFACRLHPGVLRVLATDEQRHETLAAVLSRANEHQRASAEGIAVAFDAPTDSPLTPRERDVYVLLAQGRSNREIAHSLFISEPTVKVHVRNILRKLGARTRVEAAVRAVTTRQPQASAAEDRREDPPGGGPPD
jgi:ATP/maltotriose-dependent transcriptional regulator MalT